MTIHIVGLGPAGAGLLSRETFELLQSGVPVLLRTRRHPAVEELDPEGAWPSCDDLYDAAGDFSRVYESVAERVLERARRSDLGFAVPGHPLVAEKSVERLLELASREGIPVEIHPAVSFVDLALARLRIDGSNLQVCDALDLQLDARRPALIGQVFSRDTAAALKLRLLEVYPPEHEVIALKELGTPRERVAPGPLSNLDHEPWGYLDSVLIPPLEPLEDVRRFDGLHAIIRRLHAPGGCPWDREQTHGSLRKYVLEETYEVLEAIDSGDPARLAEELGDLLLQVLMHACVAERNETFSFADISEHLARKLVRRHPHVFGDATASSASEVHQRWDQLKKAEKPHQGALDGVPASLPALSQSQSIQGRARRAGFDWPDMTGPLDKLAEELREFAEAASDSDREAEFGDILFVVAGIGQRLGVDAEQSLRAANARFRRRFNVVEQKARERSLSLEELDLPALEALWQEAKAATSAGS